MYPSALGLAVRAREGVPLIEEEDVRRSRSGEGGFEEMDVIGADEGGVKVREWDGIGVWEEKDCSTPRIRSAALGGGGEQAFSLSVVDGSVGESPRRRVNDSGSVGESSCTSSKIDSGSSSSSWMAGEWSARWESELTLRIEPALNRRDIIEPGMLGLWMCGCGASEDRLEDEALPMSAAASCGEIGEGPGRGGSGTHGGGPRAGGKEPVDEVEEEREWVK